MNRNKEMTTNIEKVLFSFYEERLKFLTWTINNFCNALRSDEMLKCDISSEHVLNRIVELGSDTLNYTREKILITALHKCAELTHKLNLLCVNVEKEPEVSLNVFEDFKEEMPLFSAHNTKLQFEKEPPSKIIVTNDVSTLNNNFKSVETQTIFSEQNLQSFCKAEEAIQKEQSFEEIKILHFKIGESLKELKEIKSYFLNFKKVFLNEILHKIQRLNISKDSLKEELEKDIRNCKKELNKLIIDALKERFDQNENHFVDFKKIEEEIRTLDNEIDYFIEKYVQS